MMKTMQNKDNHPEGETREGIVTARKCDCCGHHELGFTNDKGEYAALKPGMRVRVLAAAADEPS